MWERVMSKRRSHPFARKLDLSLRSLLSKNFPDRNRRISIDRQPSRYGIILSKYASMGGWWLSGLNGAGLLLAVTLMVASYTSLTTTSTICISSHFVADAVHLARSSVVRFFFGGILSLASTALPFVIGIHRNITRHDRFNSDEPLPHGNELVGLSEQIVLIIFMVQMILLLVSGMLFLPTLSPGFDVRMGAVTSLTIQEKWRAYEQACLTEAASRTPLHEPSAPLVVRIP